MLSYGEDHEIRPPDRAPDQKRKDRWEDYLGACGFKGAYFPNMDGYPEWKEIALLVAGLDLEVEGIGGANRAEPKDKK
ncbi:MAG TPA: hypothetical protein DDX07_04400 [Porphyromonadaceae bacterium]|nr:hypothetical protein [Porphyromonadaceae bacterium]